MSQPLFVLRRPLVTEKSSRLMEKHAYSFEVDPSATKGQVKMAVEDKFKVDVVSVHTVNVGGKFRRRIGPKGGYKSDWKKAIVRLKEGQQIKWEEAS
jgi:large subunit ribosomal protein L23